MSERFRHFWIVVDDDHRADGSRRITVNVLPVVVGLVLVVLLLGAIR